MACPPARPDAITRRPLLLAAVGRAVKHASQCRVYRTPIRAAVE
ncbi:hypothetical protein [Sulfuriferula plumbiphila]|nr:hypothetical protein [Sulfuriferula plumbiphila]